MKQHMYTELLEFLFKQICHINYLKLMNIYKHIYIAFEKKGSRRKTKTSITLIFILSYFLKINLN